FSQLHLPSLPTRRSSDLQVSDQKHLVHGLSSCLVDLRDHAAENVARNARNAVKLGNDSSFRSERHEGMERIRLEADGISGLLHRSEEHTYELQSRFDIVC